MRLQNLIIFFVSILATSSCSMFSAPTPVEELLPADADINLEYYEESAPPVADEPSVLILGTSHLGQKDNPVDTAQVNRLTSALARYKPDVVAVEHLGPDYPRGKGRDYRADFDLEKYASQWDMSFDEADSVVSAYRKSDDWPENPCRLAKSYFLQYDIANAQYYWDSKECDDFRKHEKIRKWFDARAKTEDVRLGHPIAKASGVRELTAFDYQGDDAEWFIGNFAMDQLYSGRLDALYTFWPMIPQVGSLRGEYSARYGDERQNYIKELYEKNSPEHIGLQYWAYEEKMPRMIWDGDSVGSRQTENYWLRNEKMFENVQDAVERTDAQRVLIIVGSGHKYFLDELVRRSDYRWIDPREWLPVRQGK